jgi:DNA-binding MarR family transcriptional regulator
MASNRLPALIAGIARALQGEQRAAAVGAGLLPVQWAILGYLRDANRYSNTPQALAEFLMLTKGTVSQSLKLMEAKGWIRRDADAIDRRVVRLGLTSAGRKCLDSAVDPAWDAACAALPAAECKAAEAALTRLLAEWQQSRGSKTFGVCRTCAHFRPGRAGHLCGLTGEALSDEDSQRICREHLQPGLPAIA